MDIQEVALGARVKNNIAFSGVPAGTEGVIDEHYGTGIMIAWDLPKSPLPEGYSIYDDVPAITSGILRDGFHLATELEYLDRVEEET